MIAPPPARDLAAADESTNPAEHPSRSFDRPSEEPHWFAVYTAANHEKRVAAQLAERAIPHYLPLYATISRWKDRKKRLELPLFRGYVFIQIALRDRARAVQIPGIVRLVGFGGHPALVPETDLAAIRTCLENGYRIEPHPFLSTGRRVRIIRGPLEGTEGILVRKKGMFRFVLSVSVIMQGAAVEVDAADVVPTALKQRPAGRLARGNS